MWNKTLITSLRSLSLSSRIPLQTSAFQDGRLILRSASHVTHGWPLMRRDIKRFIGDKYHLYDGELGPCAFPWQPDHNPSTGDWHSNPVRDPGCLCAYSSQKVKRDSALVLTLWSYGLHFSTLFLCTIEKLKPIELLYSLDRKGWAVLSQNRSLDLCRCHTNRSLGWHLSSQGFFRCDTNYRIVVCCLQRLYFVVGVIPKGG